jgi:hypothetical protein
MVKDLLFSKYIDMLSEPKIRRVSKAATKKVVTSTNTTKTAKTTKTTKTAKAAQASKNSSENSSVAGSESGADADDATEAGAAKDTIVTISTEIEKLKRADKKVLEGTLKVDIKFTKDKVTGKLVADSYISDGKSKIWKYNNDNCHNKENEILMIVAEILKTKREKTYIISANCKKFISNYNNALVSYKELIQQEPELNMLENIFTNQSIGQLALITKIRCYSEIIVDHNQFSFVIK